MVKMGRLLFRESARRAIQEADDAAMSKMGERMRRHSLIDIIEQLYDTTQTPKTESSSQANPDIEVIVETLHKNLSNDYDLSKEEIEKAILFILKLFDIPFDLKGSALVRSHTLHILSSALDEISLNSEIRQTLMTIVKSWFDFLPESHKFSRHYRKIPKVEESPVLFFHLQAFELSKAGNEETPSLYLSYAYEFHKAIRLNAHNNISGHTHRDYVRAGRFFFEFQPHEIKKLSDHPQTIPGKYIELFMRQYDISNNKNYSGPLSSTAKNYGRLLRNLHAHKSIHGYNSRQHWPKPFNGTCKDNREDDMNPLPPDGDVASETPDEKTGLIESLRIGEFSEEREEFEADDEIDFFSRLKGDAIVSKRPSITKKWADMVNLRNFLFPFEAKILNLFHYSILYQVMDARWNASSFDNAVILYLFILIHTGIPFRILFDLSTSAHDRTTSEDPFLKMVGGRFYIIHKSPVELGKVPNENSSCLSISEDVYVPLPDQACSMLSEHLKVGRPHVFSYTAGKTKKKRRLSANDIDDFIKRHIADVYRQYSLKITLPNIGQSFQTLYVNAGLDPIICCLISGHDYSRLYRSQAHYIRISHSTLESQYLQAFKSVDSNIRDNQSTCIAKGFLPDRSKRNAPTGKSTFFKSAQPADTMPEGYGSTIICSESYVIDMITSLKEAIKKETDPTKRHNLFTVYTYLGLQFSLGLRPRNDPDIDDSNFSRSFSLIAINDKNSGKYYEERFLPVPKLIRSLLQKMKDGFPRLKTYIALNIRPPILDEVPVRIFFLLGETGHIHHFTIKGMGDVLATAGINYDLPPNMPRHYMRNYLYDAGFCNSIADLCTGHQHAGREILNVVSSTIFAKATMEVLPEIERMLHKIKFEEMEYLPPG